MESCNKEAGGTVASAACGDLVATTPRSNLTCSVCALESGP